MAAPPRILKCWVTPGHRLCWSRFLSSFWAQRHKHWDSTQK